MILPTEIDTLDNFKRRSKAEIRKLRSTGRPTVLTVNGKPAVVVQDAAAYEQHMKLLEEFDTMASIQQGLKESEAGMGTDARTFFKQLRREVRTKRRR